MDGPWLVGCVVCGSFRSVLARLNPAALEKKALARLQQTEGTPEVATHTPTHSEWHGTDQEGHIAYVV